MRVCYLVALIGLSGCDLVLSLDRSDTGPPGDGGGDGNNGVCFGRYGEGGRGLLRVCPDPPFADVLPEEATPLDTDACPGGRHLTISGTSVCAYVNTNFSIVSLDLVATGSFPLVLVATDTLLLEGKIDASSTLTNIGPNANPVGSCETAGIGKVGLPGTTAGDGGGGGGGGTNLSSGNMGGQGGSSIVPTSGGSGGVPINSGLTLRGGCNGGVGGRGATATSAENAGGLGGSGGGAVYLIGGNEIDIAGGTILANGSPGLGGALAAAGGGGGGGGGGAGGVIGLDTPKLVESGQVQAFGGGGGGGGGAVAAGMPGSANAGGTGGSGAPGGANGGNGATSSSPAQPGGDAAAASPGGGGGGGGGGIGFVCRFVPGIANPDC